MLTQKNLHCNKCRKETPHEDIKQGDFFCLDCGTLQNVTPRSTTAKVLVLGSGVLKSALAMLKNHDATNLSNVRGL